MTDRNRENIDFHDLRIFGAPGMGQPIGDGREEVCETKKSLRFEARGFVACQEAPTYHKTDLRPTMFV